MTPPKPPARDEAVTLWRYARLFHADILSAQPARLYRAWMAEFRTPFFRSFLINQPELVARVLKERPADFPKSDRIGEGLRPLLGNSVFLSNGAVWERQRRIIDPAFEGGRLRAQFPAIQAAARACVARLQAGVGAELDIEAETSHAAADVIFRTLFSIPIDHAVAGAVFAQFRAYQRSQPMLNLAALVPLPHWLPRYFPAPARRSARAIRGLMRGLVVERLKAIEAGVAPDDLATRIMTTPDPVSGETFGTEEMVDQVAIFFLAGHETSASALAWALYLLASHPDWQEAVAAEVCAAGALEFAALSKLSVTRDVFREALRLYPPVPMMVRQATGREVLRERPLRKGDQVVLSPWHLHRHERLWRDPDAFDPGRWRTDAGKISQRAGYMPFSLGPRACPGAGFAMVEGVVLLAEILRQFRIEPVTGRVPEPMAHLTVRSRNGIWLRLVARR